MGRRKKMPEAVARVVGDRAAGRCEAMVFPVCTGGAEQLHHRQYRSRGGEHTVTNLVFICKACHDWAHAHPKESAEIGLSVHTWQEPGGVSGPSSVVGRCGRDYLCVRRIRSRLAL